MQRTGKFGARFVVFPKDAKRPEWVDHRTAQAVGELIANIIDDGRAYIFEVGEASEEPVRHYYPGCPYKVMRVELLATLANVEDVEVGEYGPAGALSAYAKAATFKTGNECGQVQTCRRTFTYDGTGWKRTA